MKVSRILKVGEWKVEDVVKQGEDKIEFEKVLGYHEHNRASFGSIKQTELVSHKVHDLEEERYFAKAVQLRLQGNWTRWCNYIQNELSWKHLLVTLPRLTSFVPRTSYNPLMYSKFTFNFC